MDNINLSMLDRLSPVELADMPPGVLADLSVLLDHDSEILKKRTANFEAALERKYAMSAYSHRQQKGVDHGTVQFADGEYMVKVNAPKRVKWDQAKLRAALDSMERDEAAHFAKVEIKIDERKFDAALPYIRDRLMVARTVETGKVNYQLQRIEAAGAAA